ncbi:MAG: Flp pilus assembly complex ATPase component TadA [Elusimicrobia bacterium]|nr:Flp pilus assembly complex ATPase component TadA [Elusimicrobiota bacterium]
MAVKGLQRRKTVYEVLLERNLLPEDKLKAADEDAKKNNRSIQQSIVELGFMGKPPLLKALSEEWRVKAVDLSQMDIEKEVVSIIPEAVARRHLAAPFAKEESVLFIAMADPRDFFVSEDIHLRTGLEVQAYLALPQDILSALDTAYGKGTGAAVSRLVDAIQGKGPEGSAPPDAPPGMELTKEEPKSDIAEVDATAPEVEKFTNAIILTALQMKASDIHIEPQEDATGKDSKILLRFRVDGMLRPGTFTVPWAYRSALMAKIKIMTSSMNITERRIPQSGRIQLIAGGNPVEFRVEIIPTAYGESCVMRILDRASVKVDIKTMGFLPDTLDRTLGLLKGIGGKKNYGLMMVCGPTGSGKSTTLYGMLNYANRPDIKILTAENPVEYNLDGIIQVPVNPDLKLGGDKVFNFASALRSFMRLDPDVIMIGEIRDEETAHIAMEAAMTGHLVFSTIHTNDAPSAISRIAEMGVPAYMVASTVKAIMAQRLGRRICKECRKEVEIKPAEIEVFKTHNVQPPENGKLWHAEGCDTCKGLGFKGRVGMHELMTLSESLRAVALKSLAADHIRKQALSEGMRTIIMDGLEKCKLGLTTVQEVLGGSA